MDREKHVDKRLEVCSEIAELNDMTLREVALREVSLYREVLHEVSDDYRGIDDDEKFHKLTEMEVDSYERENR
ncbi:hypothetical protein [Natrinema sp. DC36]|uniref:hypothetical protein n=1 Tax=Natrinema sp. DC36 TaxID=2878680 RepID=UPI001CF06D29|nr:hypothetical protein [Natrinema sp. DC36]